jgi:Domain of unknown function (DUF4340)
MAGTPRERGLMNKTTKALIILLALLGGIYAIQSLTSRTSTAETVNPFNGIDTSRVNQIAVNFGREIAITKTGEHWMITSPLMFRADPEQVSLLLARIASNPSASVAADNLNDDAAYGLGNGAASAIIGTSDGKSLDLRIGKVTPDLDGCYIELGGEKKILQLSTNLRTLVGESLTDWRDKRIFDFRISDIEAVDFALGDTLYHFFHSDTTWQVNGVNIPAARAHEIIGSLVASNAIGFIDSTMTPSNVIVDYGITLGDKSHVAGQIFKSAESEISFGELCLSNSANNQVYTVSSSLPGNILEGLRALQKDYLSKESS